MTRSLTGLLVAAFLLAACGVEPASDSTTTSPPSTTTASQSPGEAVALEPSEGVTRAEPGPDAPVEELVAGLNDAGFDLWQRQPVEDNLIFSPLSIGHSVLMARAAADEATGDAIDAALALPGGQDAHDAWNTVDIGIAASADGSDEVTVAIADRIWPRLDLEPDQEWVDLLAGFHGATSEKLDFTADPEGSREIINSWVSEQTQGLIPDLLPAGFIKPGRTLLVLSDALYFEARWDRPFGKYEPVQGTFTGLDGSTTAMPFMRELELSDRRGTGDGFVGAEIPYQDGEFSMLVMVPDEGRFAEVRDRLDHDLLAEIDSTFTTGPFELLLPKWEDDSQLDLMAWLGEIGAAPGSYPAIDPSAFLGAAVHGADIAVDEHGTVAAAATALGFEESGPPEPELTVAADQPFLYLIRHRPTGAVLFAGQVTDPAS